MKRHYGPSTMRRIGDLQHGMRVQTAILDNTAVLVQVQTELFNVYGRILVIELYCEAITIFDAANTTLNFSFESLTPAIGVQPMSGQSAALNALAQGNRVVYIGGAVAGAPVITGGEGISDVLCVDPQIIGTTMSAAGVQGVGTIGQDTAAANQTSGTCQFVIYYAPMSVGAYVTAIL